MKGYLSAVYVQLVMETVLYNIGSGRPYIKFELCRFMEKKDFLVTYQFTPIFTGHASSDLKENLTDHVT